MAGRTSEEKHRPDQSGRGRLGIYVDDVYRVTAYPGGTRISVDRAFLLFACEVGAKFDGLVLFGRTLRESEPGDYILPSWVELVELPFYPDLRSLRAVGRVGGSTLRSAWRGLSIVDSVWVFGPHPFGIALILMALVRRKRVSLGVRSDMVEYYRARLPSRRWAPLMVPLTAMDRFYKLLARRLRTTVVGEEIADDYGNRATVLPMTVSLVSESDLLKSTGERDWSGVIDLLSVGRLEAEKNPLLLLEMMNLLEQRRPGRYRLTVVGRGQLLEPMQARAVELRIDELVSFRKYVAFGDELLDLYRRSNLFVHVSLTEGVPQVLIESLATGTAVVATAVGGVPSAVAGGEAGILVPAEDAIALADAVIELTDNDDLRERIVRAGLELSRQVTLEAQSQRVAAFLASR